MRGLLGGLAHQSAVLSFTSSNRTRIAHLRSLCASLPVGLSLRLSTSAVRIVIFSRRWLAMGYRMTPATRALRCL